jgi:hypothetical protein
MPASAFCSVQSPRSSGFTAASLDDNRGKPVADNLRVK